MASPSAVAAGSAVPDTALAAAGAGHLLRCLVPSYTDPDSPEKLFSGNQRDQPLGIVKFFAVVSVAEVGGDEKGWRHPAALCGGFCELRCMANSPVEVELFQGVPIQLTPPKLWDVPASAEELKDVQLDGKVGRAWVGWVRVGWVRVRVGWVRACVGWVPVRLDSGLGGWVGLQLGSGGLGRCPFSNIAFASKLSPTPPAIMSLVFLPRPTLPSHHNPSFPSSPHPTPPHPTLERDLVPLGGGLAGA